MGKKDDASSRRELVRIFRGERSREEIALIAERVRQKIAEENRLRDHDRLLEDYRKLSGAYDELSADYHHLQGKYKRVRRALDIWRNVAIAFITSTLGLLATVILYFCAVLIRQ